MTFNVAGFVDVGFVRQAIASACGIDAPRVRLDASGLVRTVQEVAERWDGRVLRTYWYDGQFPASDPRQQSQRKYLDAVASTPGVQLRLGHLHTHTPAWHDQLRRALDACHVDQAEFTKHFDLSKHEVMTQKGVDTLLVLDLVGLGQRRAYDLAVLFSGDRDIAEAIRETQAEGRRVVLLAPDGSAVARELRELADEVVTLDAETLRNLHRAPSASRAAAPAKKTDPAPSPVRTPELGNTPAAADPDPATVPTPTAAVSPAGQAPPAGPAPAAPVWLPTFPQAAGAFAVATSKKQQPSVSRTKAPAGQNADPAPAPAPTPAPGGAQPVTDTLDEAAIAAAPLLDNLFEDFDTPHDAAIANLFDDDQP